MKKTLLFVFCLSTLFAMYACQEVNTLIDLNPPANQYDQLVLDTSFIVSSIPQTQPKNVLLEDFTAVHCDNCPLAQSIGVSLVNTYPGRVSVIGVHCTTLDAPVGNGFPDFRTAHGDDLITRLGSFPGLPQGAIDRKLFQGNTEVLLGIAFWQSNVQSEMALPAIANIDTTPARSYDPATRIFNMKFNVTFTQASSDTFYVSAAIVESGMKGSQLTPSNVNDTFTFEHVLRKAMAPWNGLIVANAPAKGKTYTINYSTVLASNWIANNCRAVVFVHRNLNLGNPKKDVEQVMEVSVTK